MMARIRSKNTKPELAVRRLVWRMGYRFRLHDRRLPGCPDLILRKRRKVVFVPGCFWHSHPGCKRATTPKTRSDYWIPKLAGNVERDRKNRAALLERGWRVLVIWECELGRPEGVAAKISQFMEASNTSNG